MNTDNLIVGLVIVGTFAYLFMKVKNMLKTGGGCSR